MGVGKGIKTNIFGSVMQLP